MEILSCKYLRFPYNPFRLMSKPGGINKSAFYKYCLLYINTRDTPIFQSSNISSFLFFFLSQDIVYSLVQASPYKQGLSFVLEHFMIYSNILQANNFQQIFPLILLTKWKKITPAKLWGLNATQNVQQKVLQLVMFFQNVYNSHLYYRINLQAFYICKNTL